LFRSFGIDLAEMYEIETKRLKEAVKRNNERFPEYFMFQLTENEWNTLLRSQFASLKTGSGRQPKYLPFAFTETRRSYAGKRFK
jgi:hypothetical protein